jgi:hypothetical protein
MLFDSTRLSESNCYNQKIKILQLLDQNLKRDGGQKSGVLSTKRMKAQITMEIWVCFRTMNRKTSIWKILWWNKRQKPLKITKNMTTTITAIIEKCGIVS